MAMAASRKRSRPMPARRPSARAAIAPAIGITRAAYASGARKGRVAHQPPVQHE